MDAGIADYAIPAVWTFQRGDASMTIARELVDGQFILTIADGAHSRAVAFGDIVALTIFQADLERQLVTDGWSLVAFAPDLRRGQERRHARRPGQDRRQAPGAKLYPGGD